MALLIAPRDRARLIGQLVEELAAPAAAPVADTHAWDEFAALADDPAVAEPVGQDSAVLISEMRR